MHHPTTRGSYYLIQLSSFSYQIPVFCSALFFTDPPVNRVIGRHTNTTHWNLTQSFYVVHHRLIWIL